MSPESTAKLRKNFTRVLLRYRDEAYDNIERNYPEKEWEGHKNLTFQIYEQEITEFESLLKETE